VVVVAAAAAEEEEEEEAAAEEALRLPPWLAREVEAEAERRGIGVA